MVKSTALMDRVTRTLLAAAAVAFAVSLTCGQARAVPSCSTTDDLGQSGSGFIPFSSVSAGFCVLAQDELYGNFNLGNLPGGGSMVFQLSALGDTDRHQLSFDGNYRSPTSYSFGYEVGVPAGAVANTIITSLDSDFTQTAGTSTLTKNTSPPGVPPSGISETKSGVFVQPGSILTINYLPNGVTDLVLTESLLDGGTVSSITNTTTEAVGGVPEPDTLLLLGSALVGLAMAALLTRRQPASQEASPRVKQRSP
jgi:hypothetical protein